MFSFSKVYNFVGIGIAVTAAQDYRDRGSVQVEEKEDDFEEVEEECDGVGAINFTLFHETFRVHFPDLEGKVEDDDDDGGISSFDIEQTSSREERKEEDVVEVAVIGEEIADHKQQEGMSHEEKEIELNEIMQVVVHERPILKNCNGTIEDFFDKYCKLRKIGEGSFGYVYLYKEKTSGHKVVAKFIDEQNEYETELEFDDGQLLEVKIMKQVTHSNIPEVIEWYCDGKEAIIIMPYMGKSVVNLSTMLKRQKGNISEENLKVMSTQILPALKLIHETGFIHQDIKPDNILFNSTTGEYFLIDLGVAKRYDPYWRTFQCSAGTSGFTPPEFVSKLPIIGPETDIFSLGVTLFQLFYGRLPSSQEGNSIHLENGPFNEPRASNEFSQLLSECLHHDPERRPSLVDILNSDWLLN